MHKVRHGLLQHIACYLLHDVLNVVSVGVHRQHHGFATAVGLSPTQLIHQLCSGPLGLRLAVRQGGALGGGYGGGL